MWYLTSESDEKCIYVLPQKREVTIGRSPDQLICDFAIQDDPSISRKHAVLVSIDDNLFVKDLGSRYGTFINNVTDKIAINTNVKLEDNNVLKFGKMNSVWTVHKGSFVTCTSTLKGENLQNVKLSLSKIGGILKSDWDDTCKFLTMPAITLTVKVVLALVQGSHIVTTEFWNKCLSAIISNEPLPNPNNYTPEILEKSLNKDVVSFLPEKKRSKLFAGKKFVFFSKRQFDMYKSVVIKASADPLLLSESKFTKSMLIEEDVIVIQYNITSTSQETEAQRNQITEIVNHLKSNGKRVVADAEIGLAILYVSLNKYCNPSFNFSSEVLKQMPAQPSNKVLAQETEEQSGTLNKRDNLIINESLASNNDSKRKLSDEDDLETSASKRLATNISNISNESAKRKHNEGDEGSINPPKKMALDNNSEDGDLFNFITPASKDQSKNKSSDKLNLAKPMKRKAGLDTNDDDLFNFVQNDKADAPRSSMFEDDQQSGSRNAKKAKSDITPEEISAMRGSKLDELKKEINWNSNILKPHNIKKEADDLDEKMNQLDIGSVVVTIKENLIIKKEPVEIEAQDSCGSLKNFKKFKKVWPVKMQVTIIPRSSMIVASSQIAVQQSVNNQEPSVNNQDVSMSNVETSVTTNAE